LRKAVSTDPILIRELQPGELPKLLELIADHAAFERASFDLSGMADRLATSLFGDVRRAVCLVAVDSDAIVGYCTVSREFSTWRAADFAHMDTLFVVESYRGRSIGERLMQAALQTAHELGTTQMEWQTPAWNTDALRFYKRLGADGSAKVRFTLEV
jgi:GNAT superfamily N-acetyltransferase